MVFIYRRAFSFSHGIPAIEAKVVLNSAYSSKDIFLPFIPAKSLPAQLRIADALKLYKYSADIKLGYKL